MQIKLSVLDRSLESLKFVKLFLLHLAGSTADDYLHFLMDPVSFGRNQCDQIWRIFKKLGRFNY